MKSFTNFTGSISQGQSQNALTGGKKKETENTFMDVDTLSYAPNTQKGYSPHA